MLTIEQLNKTTEHEFMELLGGIFEHSPWVAEKAIHVKPFSSLGHLYDEMVSVVEQATEEQKLILIKAHPNLGERIEMSPDSVNEQAGAGLKNLTPEEYDKFSTLNQQYMDKFAFPFILAVKGKNKHQIYEAMEQRVQNQRETEFQTAMKEIYKIALLRLEEKIQ
ncbi:2-oxo-4-hydroxy-4-carboxy-5-ureidoimidazoline decarboxylase [Robertmurraya yapensis]|uniref:2-oxo-4-hydroxy-4-carboxy-5-ureidoimidazoline decarboxylase n=1 Tax=Bacillus yapensis TaxID=2492960 RepID=A0A431W937_9BACI|nr:2-oxo-4-hydroxy-4-carboxy-5-ureidoimidazoline decarboxylase [Bacillus yapensis]RTR31837.1 2-oxo-4-hydroxy-4-carboxy-5-ureidoimidazoline decarboxylase [Bacillus yapensis]TKS95850.1 2-oxo-4-hydroxy-4-carboxy-5-ureidoimidazoline decarboxylase [Bacillus yapensis]